MCDISDAERRKRYKMLIRAGHTTAWARRARDFSEPHYNWHVENGAKAIYHIKVNVKPKVINKVIRKWTE